MERDRERRPIFDGRLLNSCFWSANWICWLKGSRDQNSRFLRLHKCKIHECRTQVMLGLCKDKGFFFYKLHNVLQIRKDKYIAVSREGDQLCVHSHFKKDNETMRLLSTGGKVQQFILVV